MKFASLFTVQFRTDIGLFLTSHQTDRSAMHTLFSAIILFNAHYALILMVLFSNQFALQKNVASIIILVTQWAFCVYFQSPEFEFDICSQRQTIMGQSLETSLEIGS
jgi:hypothetical protein